MYLGARSAPSEGQTLRQVVLLSKPSSRKLENRGPNHACAGRWQAGSGRVAGGQRAGAGVLAGGARSACIQGLGVPGGGAYPIALGVPRLPVQTQMHLILLLLF